MVCKESFTKMPVSDVFISDMKKNRTGKMYSDGMVFLVNQSLAY